MTTEENLKRIDAIVQAHIDAASAVWKDLPIEEQVVLLGRARDAVVQPAYSDPNAPDAAIQQSLGDPRELGLRLRRGGVTYNKPARFPTAGVVTCLIMSAIVGEVLYLNEYQWRVFHRSFIPLPQPYSLWLVMIIGPPVVGFCTGLASARYGVRITGSVLGLLSLGSSLYTLHLTRKAPLFQFTHSPVVDDILFVVIMALGSAISILAPACISAWIGSRVRASLSRNRPVKLV